MAIIDTQSAPAWLQLGGGEGRLDFSGADRVFAMKERHIEKIKADQDKYRPEDDVYKKVLMDMKGMPGDKKAAYKSLSNIFNEIKSDMTNYGADPRSYSSSNEWKQSEEKLNNWLGSLSSVENNYNRYLAGTDLTIKNASGKQFAIGPDGQSAGSNLSKTGFMTKEEHLKTEFEREHVDEFGLVTDAYFDYGVGDIQTSFADAKNIFSVAGYKQTADAEATVGDLTSPTGQAVNAIIKSKGKVNTNRQQIQDAIQVLTTNGLSTQGMHGLQQAYIAANENAIRKDGKPLDPEEFYVDKFNEWGKVYLKEIEDQSVAASRVAGSGTSSDGLDTQYFYNAYDLHSSVVGPGTKKPESKLWRNEQTGRVEPTIHDVFGYEHHRSNLGTVAAKNIYPSGKRLVDAAPAFTFNGVTNDITSKLQMTPEEQETRAKALQDIYIKSPQVNQAVSRLMFRDQETGQYREPLSAYEESISRPVIMDRLTVVGTENAANYMSGIFRTNDGEKLLTNIANNWNLGELRGRSLQVEAHPFFHLKTEKEINAMAAAWDPVTQFDTGWINQNEWYEWDVWVPRDVSSIYNDPDAQVKAYPAYLTELENKVKQQFINDQRLSPEARKEVGGLPSQIK